jgi:hypothetical protein
MVAQKTYQPYLSDKNPPAQIVMKKTKSNNSTGRDSEAGVSVAEF